ncbi:MAG: heavy metal translocating P-type ATPase, partial [Clostridia bacterium]|nr:heavy metal translocating P-type ATPase [Clostridia bacterium]
VIVSDNLSKLAEAVLLARKSLRIARENIVLAIGVKLLVLILGSLGLAGMWHAVFADVGVAVIAVLNSMRTLSKKTN